MLIDAYVTMYTLLWIHYYVYSTMHNVTMYMLLCIPYSIMLSLYSILFIVYRYRCIVIHTLKCITTQKLCKTSIQVVGKIHFFHIHHNAFYTDFDNFNSNRCQKPIGTILNKNPNRTQYSKRSRALSFVVDHGELATQMVCLAPTTLFTQFERSKELSSIIRRWHGTAYSRRWLTVTLCTVAEYQVIKLYKHRSLCRTSHRSSNAREGIST